MDRIDAGVRRARATIQIEANIIEIAAIGAHDSGVAPTSRSWTSGNRTKSRMTAMASTRRRLSPAGSLSACRTEGFD